VFRGCGSAKIAAAAQKVVQKVVQKVYLYTSIHCNRHPKQCGGQPRTQRYGVVVETLTNPERSRIGREYSVESLWINALP